MGASTKASALGGDPYPAAELPLPAGETAHGTWSKVTQDSHDFTPPRLRAKRAERARGTHRAVRLERLKEFSVMLSCLE